MPTWPRVEPVTLTGLAFDGAGIMTVTVAHADLPVPPVDQQLDLVLFRLGGAGSDRLLLVFMLGGWLIDTFANHVPFVAVWNDVHILAGHGVLCWIVVTSVFPR